MRTPEVLLVIAILCCVSQQSGAQQASSSAASPTEAGMRIIPLGGNLPAAPPGYEWKSCIKGQVEVLVPSNWEVQGRTGKNVVQCAAAEHLKVAPTEFSGLEVALYVKPDVPGIQTPGEFAGHMMSNIRNKAQSYGEMETGDRRFAYRTAQVSYNNDRAIMAYAEDRSTGTVVQIILTSPSQRWAEIESKGRVAVRNIAVVPSI